MSLNLEKFTPLELVALNCALIILIPGIEAFSKEVLIPFLLILLVAGILSLILIISIFHTAQLLGILDQIQVFLPMIILISPVIIFFLLGFMISQLVILILEFGGISNAKDLIGIFTLSPLYFLVSFWINWTINSSYVSFRSF